MLILIKIVILAAIVFIALMLIRKGKKNWWKKFEKKPYNFSFRWHGRTLWYSRSCAVASFVYCKNQNGEWCVLANQRGKGAADYKHLWNVCCGYIGFNETAEEAAIREISEEFCINAFTHDMLKLQKLVSDPSENHQNITARFFIKLEDVTTETPTFIPKIPTIDNGGEKDEVENVAWIPISEVDNYEWAFNHGEIIKEIFNEKINVE